MDGINVPKSTAEKVADEQLKFWTALNQGRVYFGTDYKRDHTTGEASELAGIYVIITPDQEKK